jgi:hypothetical protein
MKKLAVGILLFVFSTVLFCQEIENAYTSYLDKKIVFYRDGKVAISGFDMDTGRSTVREGVYFRDDSTGFGYIEIVNPGEKYLVLKNDIVCFLIDRKNRVYARCASGGGARSEFILNDADSIAASSFLVENNTAYKAQNMNEPSGRPWAESVSGNGIHEKLFIKKFMAKAIYISTGFVSFDKPQLYRENARPKRLKISVNNQDAFYVDLLDVPDYQTIKLPKALGINDTVIIEIMEVYSGTDYEDTCINSILYDLQ